MNFISYFFHWMKNKSQNYAFLILCYIIINSEAFNFVTIKSIKHSHISITYSALKFNDISHEIR